MAEEKWKTNYCGPSTAKGQKGSNQGLSKGEQDARLTLEDVVHERIVALPGRSERVVRDGGVSCCRKVPARSEKRQVRHGRSIVAVKKDVPKSRDDTVRATGSLDHIGRGTEVLARQTLVDVRESVERVESSGDSGRGLMVQNGRIEEGGSIFASNALRDLVCEWKE